MVEDVKVRLLYIINSTLMKFSPDDGNLKGLVSIREENVSQKPLKKLPFRFISYNSVILIWRNCFFFSTARIYVPEGKEFNEAF